MLPPTLERLSIGNVGCGDAGMAALAAALPATRLYELLIWENKNVTAVGWAALAAALSRRAPAGDSNRAQQPGGGGAEGAVVRPRRRAGRRAA